MSLKKLVKENRSYLLKQKSYLSRGLFYRQFHLEKAVKKLQENTRTDGQQNTANGQ